MSALLSNWHELLITLFGSILVAGTAAGVQNKIQRDDVIKSIKGGLAGGVVVGLVACLSLILGVKLT
jgi:hypothetical protein